MNGTCDSIHCAHLT